MNRFLTSAFYGCIAAIAFLWGTSAGHAQLITIWNDLTLRAIRYANIPPPVAVRHMAMLKPFFEWCLNNEWITCHWRIPSITRRWASGKVRDNAGATDMKQSLMSFCLHPDLAAVLPSPSERDVD